MLRRIIPHLLQTLRFDGTSVVAVAQSIKALLARVDAVTIQPFTIATPQMIVVDKIGIFSIGI